MQIQDALHEHLAHGKAGEPLPQALARIFILKCRFSVRVFVGQEVSSATHPAIP